MFFGNGNIAKSCCLLTYGIFITEELGSAWSGKFQVVQKE
jgi:hypothetical protein